MPKSMPESISDERFRWIKPILDKKVTIKKMTDCCPFCERTLKNWLSNYAKFGLSGLIPKSTRPKTQPNETPIWIKEQVIEFRQKNKKCALKLVNDLQKQGIKIKTRTVGNILKKEGLVKKYRTKKIKINYVKIPLQPGELVEIDVKYVPEPINGKKYYQFTAIDCASRWRHLEIFDDITSFSAINFLKNLLKIAPFKIRAIKTDNGSCFTNRYTGYLKSIDPLNPRLHELDLFCQRQNIIHYLIDPGKPAQNGKVERSHRSDQESFYDSLVFTSIDELKYKIKLWNMYYNDLQHCGLNLLTPNQYLISKVQNVLA